MGLAVLINQSLKIKFLWLSWQPLTAQKSVGVPTHAGGFLLIEKFFGEAQARAGLRQKNFLRAGGRAENKEWRGLER